MLVLVIWRPLTTSAELIRTGSAAPSVEVIDRSWVLLSVSKLVKKALRSSGSEVVLKPPVWMGLQVAETQFAAAMFFRPSKLCRDSHQQKDGSTLFLYFSLLVQSLD